MNQLHQQYLPLIIKINDERWEKLRQYSMNEFEINNINTNDERVKLEIDIILQSMITKFIDNL